MPLRSSFQCSGGPHGRRGGLARVVRPALVVGVLADGERLRVAGVVGRVGVVGALLGVVLPVAEVLRLPVPTRPLPLAGSLALSLSGSPALSRGGALRPAAALAVATALAAVLLRLPVRRSALGRGGWRPAVRGLLTVRLLLRGLLGSRLRCAVVPAASDPESSHVIERTWSGGAVGWGRGWGTGFAAEL